MSYIGRDMAVGGGRIALLWAAIGTLLATVATFGAPAAADRRHLANSAAIYREIPVVPTSSSSAKRYLLTFRDYQDIVLYDAVIGYYARGRVSFRKDYQTFATALAPYFGEMIAAQIFRMWEGMRQAGTLGPSEPFIIAEFGGGNGMLAESILDYLEAQASRNVDRRWSDFAAHTLYVSYDLSPALSAEQRSRNVRFGNRFQARHGDATDIAALMMPQSMKGVILSNEMPDNFAVHKVVLSADGTVEVAFVVPSLSENTWNRLRKFVPLEVLDAVTRGDREIRHSILAERRGSAIYLTRAAFVAVLYSLSSDDYVSVIRDIDVHEVYEPVQVIPELAEYFKCYAQQYAYELAKHGKGMVTYVSLGQGQFIRGAAQALRAGYVMTIDYGANWDGIAKNGARPHLRTYGPGTGDDDFGRLPNKLGPFLQVTKGDWRNNSRPYREPTLNDITSDVNFSYMAAEGQRLGLKTAYFGPQSALLSGTGISLENAIPRRPSGETVDEFRMWADMFVTDREFKLLVQQKEQTDSLYVYPITHSEPLDLNEQELNAKQQQAAIQVRKAIAK